MTWAVFDPWIVMAKQWQPLLASLLAVLAAIILAAGMIRAARIRAAKPAPNPSQPQTADLRAAALSASIDSDMLDSMNASLDKLRSLLRSALSCLSSTDKDDDAARALCARIAAFQWRQFPLPVSADKRMQETYATFLNQFELLQLVLGKEWSSSEASAILIQMNANARALSANLKQIQTAQADTLSQQNHS